MLQEILPKVLKPDMNSVLSSPEHLELFLLAQQKVPEKLKKLMGSVNLFSTENMPRYEGGGWMALLGTVGLHMTVHRCVERPRAVPTTPGALGPVWWVPPESPRAPPQTGDCSENGCHCCEEGTQAAHRGAGPAAPSTEGGQVPTVLEGGRGTRPAAEALLACQVCMVLVLSQSPDACLLSGDEQAVPRPPGDLRALTSLCRAPLSYLCFRLLGAALPLLSHEQLQLVMQGDLIRHYGEHMVTSKVGAAPKARNSQAAGCSLPRRRVGCLRSPAWDGPAQLLGEGPGT